MARYLFRRVVSWGRSSNVFLRNGARLYLDVGSHPEYATAECDSLAQLVTHDKAGERILEDLLVDAEQRLADEGIGGDIYLFKNNTDSAGNSYGCHENYLIARAGEFSRISDVLLPFLVTRQLICGAGKVLQTPRGAVYCLSQRAEHIWEGVSSATTRSRPIINTRDEPHADAERYRRLHVIVGDSNMCEATTLLKVGSAHLVLEMIEAGRAVPRLHPGQPDPRDPRGQPRPDRPAHGAAGRRAGRPARWTSSASTTPAPSSTSAARGAPTRPTIERVVDLWGRTLDAVETQDLSQGRQRDRLGDQAPAGRALPATATTWTWPAPEIAQLDLAYHDITRGRGVFDLLQRKGMVDRVTDDGEIEAAKDTPPQTTRAKLRGEFIAAAQEAGRDFTVDWVHLKLNDQAQRTVLCKDPFRSVDERVDRLIARCRRRCTRRSKSTPRFRSVRRPSRRGSGPRSAASSSCTVGEVTLSSLRPGSMPIERSSAVAAPRGRRSRRARDAARRRGGGTPGSPPSTG